MADADYRRLGTACHCGEPVKLWSGRGRPPKYCGPPCSEQAKRQQQNASNRAAYVARPLKTVLCIDCGVAVETRSSGLKRCEQCRLTLRSMPRKSRTASVVCAAAGCDEYVKRKIAGAKYCSSKCRIAVGNATAALRVRHTCEACSAEFFTDRRKKGTRWCQDECTPKALRGLFSCLHCQQEYRKKHRPPGQGEKYCSRRCSFDAKAASRLRRKEAGAPKYSAYFAKACARCDRPDGQRIEWTLCRECKRADRLRAASEASRALAEAKHKAAAREVACDECGSAYCPLYGANRGPKPLCSDACSDVRRKQNARAGKIKRRAVERGANAEHVNPWRVFARDGWMCRLCGIETPKKLRGSIAHNAPELDHVHPVSKGGAHTYANTQCLCRSCNQFKLDRTMEQVECLLAL